LFYDKKARRLVVEITVIGFWLRGRPLMPVVGYIAAHLRSLEWI
jgi:hypothetical protein